MTPSDTEQADHPRHERPLVLVTGSNGPIGRALTESLGKYCKVVGLDAACGGASHPCIEADLTEKTGEKPGKNRGQTTVLGQKPGTKTGGQKPGTDHGFALQKPGTYKNRGQTTVLR
jgi:NAD(P)-dependent dehydrogenase (short-subunit alcohol dehydrogenase family)